jgi:hypothetical protein
MVIFNEKYIQDGYYLPDIEYTIYQDNGDYHNYIATPDYLEEEYENLILKLGLLCVWETFNDLKPHTTEYLMDNNLKSSKQDSNIEVDLLNFPKPLKDQLKESAESVLNGENNLPNL